MKLPLTTLSARDRTTLLVGAGIIGALLLGSRGVPAWLRWQRQIQDDAAATSAEAAASRRAVQRAPLLARTARQMERRYLALVPALIAGDHAAAGGTALISTVNAAARAAGVQVGALQVDPDTAGSNGITPVRVRGDGAGDIAGIARFLTTIEGGVPLLSVRELSMTPADLRGTGGAPETIRVRFVIEGLARYGPPDGNADEPGDVQEGH